MNEATQTGVAMAAISVVSTLAGLFFGWLSNRDKLRHDTKTAALENKVAVLETKQAQCEQDSKECKEERERTKAELAALHAKDATDRAALQAQINALKKGN